MRESKRYTIQSSFFTSPSWKNIKFVWFDPTVNIRYITKQFIYVYIYHGNYLNELVKSVARVMNLIFNCVIVVLILANVVISLMDALNISS